MCIECANTSVAAHLHNFVIGGALSSFIKFHHFYSLLLLTCSRHYFLQSNLISQLLYSVFRWCTNTFVIHCMSVSYRSGGIEGSKDWNVWNIIIFWNGKIDPLQGSTLLKIWIVSKNDSIWKWWKVWGKCKEIKGMCKENFVKCFTFKKLFFFIILPIHFFSGSLTTIFSKLSWNNIILRIST